MVFLPFCPPALGGLAGIAGLAGDSGGSRRSTIACSGRHGDDERGCLISGRQVLVGVVQKANDVYREYTK